jgi:hypothetical protein
VPRSSTTGPTKPGQPRHAGQVFIYMQSCRSDLYPQKDLLLGRRSWFPHVRHQRTNTALQRRLNCWRKIRNIVLLRRDFCQSATSWTCKMLIYLSFYLIAKLIRWEDHTMSKRPPDCQRALAKTRETLIRRIIQRRLVIDRSTKYLNYLVCGAYKFGTLHSGLLGSGHSTQGTWR